MSLQLIHSKKVVSCFEDELVISALRLMDSALVSSVAVLDVHGKIVGVVSSFDLVGSSHESIISNLFKTLGKVSMRIVVCEVLNFCCFKSSLAEALRMFLFDS
jgi:CBS domain-containing protein